jgi:hypothetical protein
MDIDFSPIFLNHNLLNFKTSKNYGLIAIRSWSFSSQMLRFFVPTKLSAAQKNRQLQMCCYEEYILLCFRNEKAPKILLWGFF